MAGTAPGGTPQVSPAVKEPAIQAGDGETGPVTFQAFLANTASRAIQSLSIPILDLLIPELRWQVNAVTNPEKKYEICCLAGQWALNYISKQHISVAWLLNVI
jgi:hypothetical protein